jgi:surface antigen
MTSLVKFLPFVVLVGLSALPPFRPHPPVHGTHPSAVPTAASGDVKPVAVRPDGRTTVDWTALEAAWQRDFDAAQEVAAREAAAREAAASEAATSEPAAAAVAHPDAVPIPSAPGNHFTFGYCTWYVANKRPIPWFGNAIDWWPNAAALGYAEGQQPRVGAVMVTRESGYDHVAYVESVNADGSWVVSEMAFYAWDVVDFRTIRPGQVPLVGFIYNN